MDELERTINAAIQAGNDFTDSEIKKIPTQYLPMMIEAFKHSLKLLETELDFRKLKERL